jgi:carbonic anhydrase/acetyltransferase-like protein (isoleucine patch superfamily)
MPQTLSAGENVVIAEGTRVCGHVIIGPGVELGPGATVPAQVVRFANIFRGLRQACGSALI